MREFIFLPCSEEDLRAVSALFLEKLWEDPVFRSAFPTRETASEHCREFTEAYARRGEIHRLREDGQLLAAALWSLPGQSVPSPTWDFPVAEPCCKLYLLASRRPGAGSLLLAYGQGRFSGTPLVTFCLGDGQADYFLRRGFLGLDSPRSGTRLFCRNGGKAAGA